jgi:membrane-associated phospholipid phosphatase
MAEERYTSADKQTADRDDASSLTASSLAASLTGGDNAAGTEITVSPRRAVRRAKWAEIVFGAGLVVYAVMAVLAHRYEHFGWDIDTRNFIQSISIPGFGTLMTWISVLGNGWVPVTLVGGFGLAFLTARFRIEGVVCIFGVAFGGAMNRLLKALTDRPRPPSEHIFNHESFPSGHVVFFIEFFGFLFFLSYVLLRRGKLRRTSLALLGAFVLLIGVSRVYLSAHWPSDVVGAYLAGGLWLMLMIEVYRRLKARQKNKIDPVATPSEQ